MKIAKLPYLALPIFLAMACTEQVPPVLGEPVPITVPSTGNSIGPRLSQSASSDTILSWMERDEKGATLQYSRFQLGKWLAATSVIKDPKMFVNWADLPAVTPSSGDSLLAHWLSYSAASPYAYDVKIRQSTDGGQSWSDAQSPHSDGTPTEHGFVSIYPSDEGTTGLIWLDGRKTGTVAGDDLAMTGMTLRGARLTTDERLVDEVEIDDLICDCCQTDVALTRDGPVAVYRNRTQEEIRDIFVTRMIDGQWQPGVPVSQDNWRIAGCPVNGPAIDAAGKRVAIAWFSAADDQPVVRAIVSSNSGASFSAPVEIATTGTQGRVGMALLDEDSFVVSWLEAEDDGRFAINVRTVTMKGQLGQVSTVGRTGLARVVPQMARVNDELILAWTGEFGNESKVVSIRLPILGFYDDLR